jgi:hypothetical protein
MVVGGDSCGVELAAATFLMVLTASTSLTGQNPLPRP